MAIELRLLTTDDVEDLYPRLRLEDKEETICLGSNPREALLMGAFDNLYMASLGRAYALVNPAGTVIGALGFTSSGFLWALSAPFSRSERRELFTRTREILDRLISEAGKRGALFEGFLHNLIHARNRVAIKWLERSGLFNIDLETPVEVGAEVFYTFRTKTPHERFPLIAVPPAPKVEAAHV